MVIEKELQMRYTSTRRFLYLKQQARRLLVNADHIVGKSMNNFLNTKALSPHSISSLFLPRVIILIINMQS